MKVLAAGHHYALQDNNSEESSCDIKFYTQSDGSLGTTNQEVIRALIDRMHFLDKEMPHVLNRDTIDCLRRALINHEIRHLERLIDKDVAVENIPIQLNGHFV